MTRTLENWGLHSLASYCQDMDVFPDLIFCCVCVFFSMKFRNLNMYVAFPLVFKAQTKQEAAGRQISFLGIQLMTFVLYCSFIHITHYLVTGNLLGCIKGVPSFEMPDMDISSLQMTAMNIHAD